MQTKKIECNNTREIIARTILESLPDWFGIPEAREEYIADSKGKPFFCTCDGERPVGFLYLKETGRHTIELADGSDIPDTGEFVSHKDNCNVVLGWMPIEKLAELTIYPDFIKETIYELDVPLRHFITRA